MKQWLGLVARLVTGGVWLWAGASKLPDLNSSEVAVRGYQLLPESMVQLVGAVLPGIEVLVGLFLLLGCWVRPAAVVSAVLFGGFVLAIGSVWARGIEIDCGCFGGGGAEAGASADYPWEIARDVGLLAASLWLVVRPHTPWSLAGVLGHQAREPNAPDQTFTPVEHEDERSGAGPDFGRDR